MNNPKLSHSAKRVLIVLQSRWLFYGWGGNSWTSFKALSKEINRSLNDTKSAVYELRDAGIVYHSPMINSNGTPCGSGYFLKDNWATN